MKSENYTRRAARIAGWDVAITSYKLGDCFYCKVDNVSPGAVIARAKGTSLEEAEQVAIDDAMRRLHRTRKNK